jgi:cell division protein ZapB
LNLLTEIPLQHYSGEMISEFHQLSEKIVQVSEMAQSLRRENADLRLTIATLTAENTDLAKRIEEAYQRVSALLDKIPAAGDPPTDEANQEAA